MENTNTMNIQSFSSASRATAASLPRASQAAGFEPGNSGDLVDLGRHQQDMGPDPITPLYYATVGGLGGGVAGATVGAIWASRHGVLAGIGGGVGGAVVGGVVGIALAGVALKLQN